MKKTTSHYRHLFFLMFSGNPCIYIGGGEVDGGRLQMIINWLISGSMFD